MTSSDTKHDPSAGPDPFDEDEFRVSLPRWLVRLTLALCPIFALTIAGLALMMMTGAWLTGFGGFLFGLFWLGATAYCLWNAVLILLYLRREPRLTNAGRYRLGGISTIILLGVAVLSMAVLLVVE